MSVFYNYKIPAGYVGTLYSGDVFLYYPDEDLDIASGWGLCEEDADEWYEDLDECTAVLEQIDPDRYFAYPRHDFTYARIVVDAIVLDGTEEPGLNGWDYQRVDYPVYLGPIVQNENNQY